MDWLFAKLNNFMIEKQKKNRIKKIRREMSEIKRDLNAVSQNFNYAISLSQINEGISKITQYNKRYMKLYNELKEHSLKDNIYKGAGKWIFR